LKLRERGVGRRGVGKLQTVNAGLVETPGDFCAEHFCQRVNVRVRLDLHQKFVGNVPAGRLRRAHKPRRVLHFGGENIQARDGVGLRRQLEIQIAKQHP
jgi:hypothetical protein